MRAVVTGQQVVEDRHAINRAITRLALKTGALQVRNSWCLKSQDMNRDAVDIIVGFSSAGWTGR